jgi:hypothetical protein
MTGEPLMSLEAWGRAIYGESCPKLKTLRKWAREAKIVPVPKKNGRSYFVSRHARYIDYDDPNYADAVAGALNEPQRAHSV